jgi:peroxisome-assembly ATPase
MFTLASWKSLPRPMAWTTSRRLSSICNSVVITDPLVKYQSLVATGVYAPDPSQHRLARHLQRVYLRLKDYAPRREYRQILQQITELEKPSIESEPVLAVKSHPIWRNPLFKRLFSGAQGKGRDSLSLIRVLTNHEAALQVDSPTGLFLSGEVGTGKSMLLDLLSGGLPTERKRRWHFNTFMLYTFSQLEAFRRSRPSLLVHHHEYSLLWMAKKLIEESPILFLDEFQLPDRAASKILSHLLIAFFQLGGVLVASSNRMPEELQKATGVEYTLPPFGGFMSQFLGTDVPSFRGKSYGSTGDFSVFLEVLKARCDFWHMDGAKDWRRGEGYGMETLPSGEHSPLEGQRVAFQTIPQGPQVDEDVVACATPSNYVLISDSAKNWQEQVANTVGQIGADPIRWAPLELAIYGRVVIVPRQYGRVCYWDFNDLVLTKPFGPADYITMASNYHTFIIDNVPVLTMSKKIEARRFITLVDALYEARCKLTIRAEIGPDSLFFPETRLPTAKSREDAKGEPLQEPDATYSETIAEVYQDHTSPFRPNISYYDTESSTSMYDPDQDSDFILEKDKRVDFSNTGAFTGEDERFAYKRATSRLWELCSTRWHARTGDWWQPLPAEARHWERSSLSAPRAAGVKESCSGDVRFGPSIELEEPAGLQGLRVELHKKKDVD